MVNEKKQLSAANVFKLIIYWRILITLFFFFGLQLVTPQLSFLGGGSGNYLNSPQFWAWANFDGEHYLAIAKFGYQPLTYFYFPFYPMLISLFERFFDGSFSYLFSGLFVSHASLLFSLIGLIKLTRLYYGEKVSFWVVITVLVFPTSFYFGGVYTESLFFALAVWSMYFAFTGKYIMAGILGGLASATRITGIALLPALFFEYYFGSFNNLAQGRILKNSREKVISLILCASGILLYMYYLKVATGDYLSFFRNLGEVFGQQRSGSMVLLPQVFYRYFFKILPNINWNYFPVVFTTIFELSSGILLSVATIFSFIKLRPSLSIYMLVVFLLPTFSGSFSSLPRYALIAFPMFLLMGMHLANTTFVKRLLIISANLVLLAIGTILFTRGYWVS